LNRGSHSVNNVSYWARFSFLSCLRLLLPKEFDIVVGVIEVEPKLLVYELFELIKGCIWVLCLEFCKSLSSVACFFYLLRNLMAEVRKHADSLETRCGK